MNRIEHQGIITELGSKSLFITILQNSGCVSCSVKGACNVSEVEEKRIEIKHFSGNYHVGDRVTVYYQRALGFTALFWGYMLPFILLMIVLVSLAKITGNEGLSGLVALGSLVPYYGILYLFRKQIDQKFDFQIEPQKQ